MYNKCELFKTNKQKTKSAATKHKLNMFTFIYGSNFKFHILKSIHKAKFSVFLDCWGE